MRLIQQLGLPPALKLSEIRPIDRENSKPHFWVAPTSQDPPARNDAPAPRPMASALAVRLSFSNSLAEGCPRRASLSEVKAAAVYPSHPESD
jgi:hypothetical protein